MIKLAITIKDAGHVVNLGGDIEVSTYIVEIDNKRLELLLKPQPYTTKSISVVREQSPDVTVIVKEKEEKDEKIP